MLKKRRVSLDGLNGNPGWNWGHAVVEPDACARELTWICEHWDRVEEANVLRFNYG